MRIVFDTNVYVSALGVPGSKAELALRLADQAAFELVVSPEILSEAREKLVGTKFGFSESELNQAERFIKGFATLVEPDIHLSVLEDKPDNRILECAVEAGAAAIVTGEGAARAEELRGHRDHDRRPVALHLPGARRVTAERWK